MTNTGLHAKRELDILVKSNNDPDNRPIIEPFIAELVALCDKFGSSGQSGGSAPFTASALSKAIKNLCMQEPICPITGIDEEWNDVTEMKNKKALYQNNRCSAIFKEGKDGIPYYLDAIIWKDEHGFTYGGSALDKSGNKILSRQHLQLPFTPKTFYIDVISEEVKKDDWIFHIKDERQLDKVFKYYIHPCP